MSISWKKIKKSGNYYRSLSMRRAIMLQRAREVDMQMKNNSPEVQHQEINESISNENNNEPSSIENQDILPDREDSDSDVVVEDEETTEDEDEIKKNENLRTSLRKWAIEFSIKHSALKSVIGIINLRFEKGSNILPEDPRTFLQTPRTVKTIALSDGEYWHNGFENCLKDVFVNISEHVEISVNINMDGLPLFKSSKTEFWPILFNITEMPEVPPMAIGIFCGKTKCNNLDSFLLPFVEEMKKIMADGLVINSYKITVSIRCFVCDSPARAFIKGNKTYIINCNCFLSYTFFQVWLILTVNMGVLSVRPLANIVILATQIYFQELYVKNVQMKNSDKIPMGRITKLFLHYYN